MRGKISVHENTEPEEMRTQERRERAQIRKLGGVKEGCPLHFCLELAITGV